MKVWIEAKGVTESLSCEGETIVVNLHGARMSTTVPLGVGMKIQIHVLLTDKRALANVVYVDPDWPRHCGIGLEKPENIWGVSLVPDDWHRFHVTYEEPIACPKLCASGGELAKYPIALRIPVLGILSAVANFRQLFTKLVT
jgi:hypothetical protein